MAEGVRKIRIGTGAGYAGDRIEPAIELARDGNLDYLVFECLAERTIALAQQERLQFPERGYTPLLAARMRAVLPYMFSENGARRFRIITNMGASNPRAAARVVAQIAQELRLPPLRIATMLGDDVHAHVKSDASSRLDIGVAPAALGDRLISANAYLGADGIVQALAQGADIVITGRVADPSLFVAPQVFEFGHAWDDWDALGKATVVGHLMECSGQVTGGYFADPAVKDVAGLARLGYPIAEVDAHGDVVITKVAGSGGEVTIHTCAEQLLYEVHDPARYLTPDVSADFTSVRFESVGPDRVRVLGGGGRERPSHYKVSLGYNDGFIGEGQISYGGPGALQRALLAREILLERMQFNGIQSEEYRADIIGASALYGAELSGLTAGAQWTRTLPEARVRLVGRCAAYEDAVGIGNEVESLYTTGPASGGGVHKSVKEVLAIASMLLPREAVKLRVTVEECK